MDLGAVLARGAVAGLAGGMLLRWPTCGTPTRTANRRSPFLAISTIFHGTKMPVMSQPDVIAGLVLHLALSLLFGIVFAIGVVLLRLPQRRPLLLAAAVGCGLALYVVNFQIIGRAAFPFFVNPKGPNQIFELWIHPVAYGLLLVPFFLGFRASPRR